MESISESLINWFLYGISNTLSSLEREGVGVVLDFSFLLCEQEHIRIIESNIAISGSFMFVL